jgi:gamma-glutamyltranspeptidase/glutathione hydrolase
MSPTIVLRDGRPFMATGAAGGSTIITTVLGILVNRIDRGMDLPAALAAPRASQRNSKTTTAEPAFIALPTTPGLESLGQSFAVSNTSPLDPSITIPPTIGVASGLEVLGPDHFQAVAEPVRRGGGVAGVLRDDTSPGHAGASRHGKHGHHGNGHEGGHRAHGGQGNAGGNHAHGHRRR